MIIGIDLLWLRPQICGGTEAVVRNLIEGFGTYDKNNEYILFTGRDVSETFKDYEIFKNIKVVVCKVNSLNRFSRIIWENLFFDAFARKTGVDLIFVPVYSKPNSKSIASGGVPYITVIHDLQALHYPEYFSRLKMIFSKRSWKKACNESVKVVTGSLYCREDICDFFPVSKDKLDVIYDPVAITKEQGDEREKLFASLSDKYGIEEDKYYYTVSSMLPHKNLNTLLRLMRENEDGVKLVVSGVGGNKGQFNDTVKQYGIQDKIIDTGFVSEKERDVLYEKCRLFLFPSVFEGFGIPPIEAMMNGARVVAGNHPCIKEVTAGNATYVSDAKNVEKWQDAIKEALRNERRVISFPQYEVETAAKAYIKLFDEIGNEYESIR